MAEGKFLFGFVAVDHLRLTCMLATNATAHGGGPVAAAKNINKLGMCNIRLTKHNIEVLL
jgi:hypothetical protein